MLGEQIGAAGEGAVDAHALARDRGGDLGGRDVLRDVARLEPRHDDLGPMPAASSAAISALPISVPFLSTMPPLRIECTAIAPSASRGGTAPNFMPPLQRLAPAAAISA